MLTLQRISGAAKYSCNKYPKFIHLGKVFRNSLTLSENCVKQLKNIAENNMLRVSVEGGGCSGFQYKYNLDSVVNSDDKVFEQDGVKVVVDELSLDYLKGSTIDYHEELIRSSFRIVDNPQSEKGCSCGASFTIKF